MTTLHFDNKSKFSPISDLIAIHANERSDTVALRFRDVFVTYKELQHYSEQILAAIQYNNIPPHTAIAIASSNPLLATLAFLGVISAACVAVPISLSSSPEQIASVIADACIPLIFLDGEFLESLPSTGIRVANLDEFDSWLAPEGFATTYVDISPADPFNIIYSSGTTGTPKGIIHTHGMRWSQIAAYGQIVPQCDSAVTLIATPIYSNTTLVSLLPSLACGGTAVLMGKFDAYEYLVEAQNSRATHTMLVPVQYQRIMALTQFDDFDLGSFIFKSCTGAPFSPELKADVIRRWPGALLEIYGMTEGGGTCVLLANECPNKLHTVGKPVPGCEIRLIDAQGNEVNSGDIGEVVGRSNMMMAGYHGRPDMTHEATWIDANGNGYIRHGDLGRFDKEGFLTLLGRTKDMIISGGFNVYPTDIEAVLRTHPLVEDCAVIGIPSVTWGETPFAFYVSKDDLLNPHEVITWVNERMGKTQRLSGAQAIAQLPLSATGKVLKRELRALFLTEHSTPLVL
ncbi:MULTISPECIES: class I adenylate-forming enzyme family protein [Serratia]|uniref:class I adenylate-forming enzyme family protein n=1 Tax=Serratia TaxID=613 RepID=UPI0027936B85|nr:class I adenylate-forming enzyme family protein [Serratia marcescens]MDP8841494.1 class I adenylate-forming enzyme family protein [Serratia marcescens]HEJ7149024.1 acyl--CoA ligase [Serratia marcescens]HEJ7272608.1 acyl--CoA ligase [Serratia marcescens]HEJ8018258.1 acyl--CoA ligase [Serratia marcescens]HEJ8112952.1 acyl--CoA ligase [Serratia marcescens]